MSGRIAALIRVSTDHQNVEVQRAQIERWATAQESVVSAWYVEPATSGAAKRRPELDRLLADARRGGVGTLVVAALDRLGRSAVNVMSTLLFPLPAGISVGEIDREELPRRLNVIGPL